MSPLLTKTLKTLSIIACLVFAGIIFLTCYLFESEGICKYDSWIDTCYSEEYSETKFNLIEPGMDSLTVIQMIGTPLHRFTESQSKQQPANIYVWRYTNDGKCKYHDYGWHSRYVRLNEEGKVINTTKDFYYD